MRKLLVIANLYHASPRIPALVYPLREMGWEVTIVTPDIGTDAERVLGLPEGFRAKVNLAVAPYRGDVFWILRHFLSFLRFSDKHSYTEQLKERIGGGGKRSHYIDKLMYMYQSIFAIPDTEWPWHSAALRTAERLLVDQNFDAILSSSPFPTVHRVAAKLKKRYGLMWVADFRDPWSQSHNYKLSDFRRRIDTLMEVRTIREADLITTVSYGVAQKLKQLHGDRVKVIRNGFQRIPFALSPTVPDRFTISYTGTIYTGKQDPRKMLAALRNIIDSGDIRPDEICLNFYGRYDSNLQESIVSAGLENVAYQHGVLSRMEIRLLQRSSHLLLLLLWEDPTEVGIFPLKFYEYLDSDRPIIATGQDGSGEISAILEETGAGSVVASVSEIELYVLKCYREYKELGTVIYHGNRDKVYKYSFDNCSRMLVDALQSIKKHH